MRSKFVVFAISIPRLFAADTYFPSGVGRRRWTKTPEEVRSLAGMDPDKLNLIRDKFLQLFAGSWQIVILRHGYRGGAPRIGVAYRLTDKTRAQLQPSSFLFWGCSELGAPEAATQG